MDSEASPELTIEDGVLIGSSRGNLFGDEVAVSVDGRPWATVPSFPRPDQTGRSFRCTLPPVPEGANGSGTVSVADLFGEPIAKVVIPSRRDRVNARGVPASRVLSLCNRPFFAVPYMSFDGAVITLAGSHLPPGGDPSALAVEFGPGVAYDFRYPMESPEWARHFWYWPNAAMSNFQLKIDLAASVRGSNPFTFRFKYNSASGHERPEPHGRVWIPSDLAKCVGLPTDPSQLTRVQTWSDSRSVTLTGYNHFRAIQALFARHGVSPDRRQTVLDWGCGHGRLTRHMISEWRSSSIIGMDVDADNIAWARANLVPGRFIHSPLLPPSPLSDGAVDAIFSVSVMTHLAPDIQRAWLADLARIVRPDGIVLMSFAGPGAVAWSSVWNGPDYFDAYFRDGFEAGQQDAALRGHIDDTGYYRNVAQTHDHVRREWTEHFDIIDIVEEAIGNLDVAVLRRR